MLLQLASCDHNSYASHSLRIGVATSAATAGLPAWLIEAMGRWSSDAYQMHIQCPASTLQAMPRILYKTNTAQQPPWDPDTN